MTRVNDMKSRYQRKLTELNDIQHSSQSIIFENQNKQNKYDNGFMHSNTNVVD